MPNELVYPPELVSAIAGGRCVLWAGSGLSAMELGTVTWPGFVQGLAKQLNLDGDPAVNDYPLEFLEYASRADAATYTKAVRDLLNPTDDQIELDVQRILCALPFSALITTNLDPLLEQGCHQASRKFTVIAGDRDVIQINREALTIIKLHGTISNLSGRVLTQGEYDDFEESHRVLEELTKSYLFSNTVLVVGSGLKDQNFKRLFSYVSRKLGGLHAPVFYLGAHVPHFVQKVWEARKFNFIDVSRTKQRLWIHGLSQAVNAHPPCESQSGERVVGRWSKKLTLLRLGQNLSNYSELQEIYTMLVQLADYSAFSSSWERTLYIPIQKRFAKVLKRMGTDLRLAYIAPGSHVPACDGDGLRMIKNQVTALHLMDIDRSVLEHAAEVLRKRLPEWTISSILMSQVDVTGGLGQETCRRLSDLVSRLRCTIENGMNLEMSRIDAEIKQAFRVIEAEDRRAGIPFGTSTNANAAFDVVYSEMIVSFTATPIVMAFRSAVIDALGPGKQFEVGQIMESVMTCWRQFNDWMFGVHLGDLKYLLRPGGMAIVVYDTKKIFDSGEVSESFTAPNFDSVAAKHGFQVVAREDFIWRDHDAPFEISIGDNRIRDFLAHRHEVVFHQFKRLM